MNKRVEFQPNPNDPEWELKYWSGAIDSHHGSVFISSATSPLGYEGRRIPGLPYYSLAVKLRRIYELDYPTLLANKYGGLVHATDGRWEISAKAAFGFLTDAEKYLFLKGEQVAVGIAFQEATAITNTLPSSERTNYRLTIGETYSLEMTELNNKDIYDQKRFKIPDLLDPAYLIAAMELGLVAFETPGERIIEGLTMRWRSKKAAEITQAYFGGGITDITDAGYRNVWGVKSGRELLAKVQPYFKLRYIVDFEKLLMSDPVRRDLFTDYHRAVVNQAVQHLGKVSSDQVFREVLSTGYILGMRQCLDALGLAAYTEKSQQQAARIIQR